MSKYIKVEVINLFDQPQVIFDRPQVIFDRPQVIFDRPQVIFDRQKGGASLLISEEKEKDKSEWEKLPGKVILKCTENKMTLLEYFCSMTQSVAASKLMLENLKSDSPKEYNIKFYYLDNKQIKEQNYSISKYDLDSKLLNRNQETLIEKNIIYANNPIYKKIRMQMLEELINRDEILKVNNKLYPKNSLSTHLLKKFNDNEPLVYLVTLTPWMKRSPELYTKIQNKINNDNYYLYNIQGIKESWGSFYTDFNDNIINKIHKSNWSIIKKNLGLILPDNERFNKDKIQIKDEDIIAFSYYTFVSNIYTPCSEPSAFRKCKKVDNNLAKSLNKKWTNYLPSSLIKDKLDDINKNLIYLNNLEIDLNTIYHKYKKDGIIDCDKILKIWNQSKYYRFPFSGLGKTFNWELNENNKFIISGINEQYIPKIDNIPIHKFIDKIIDI